MVYQLFNVTNFLLKIKKSYHIHMGAKKNFGKRRVIWVNIKKANED